MAKFFNSFDSKTVDMRALADFIKYTKDTPEECSEEYGTEEGLAAENTQSSRD